MYLFILVYRRV